MKEMIMNEEMLQEVSGGTQIPYTVVAGDTIEGIAKHFHCTVEQICRWNNLRNPQDIRPGRKLVIYF
jgi:LysM repeat protein